VLEGQRRVQRSRLTNALAKIFVAVVICGGLVAAIASGGGFNTASKGSAPVDSSGAAMGGALCVAAVGIVLAFWVVLRYRRNMDKAKHEYERKLSGAGVAEPGVAASRPGAAASDSFVAKLGHEVSEHASSFASEGQLSGGHGLRPGDGVPDEEQPSFEPDYSALAEVEHGGEGGVGPDGVNRSGDAKRGAIE
jgi:hypothetical protein